MIAVTGERVEKGAIVTRRGIRTWLGGSTRAGFPTAGGRVICICVTREMNPRAPRELLIGGGERSVRLARGLAAAGDAIPLFVRARPDAWEYTGDWRVRAVVDDPFAVRSRAAAVRRSEVTLVLLMEERAASDAVAQTATEENLHGDDHP